jgi:pyruvate,water dikinase
MSHAAIVCREYGLPAVVGTGRATATIETGQMVRVDGSTGVVTILDS